MQKNRHIALFKFLILLVLTFTFYAFSNSFQGKTGRKQVWKIEKITYDYKKLENGKDAVSKPGEEMNAGTFTFNGDSTGSYSYVLDKMERKGTFKQSPVIARTFLYSLGMSKNELVVRNTYSIIEEEPHNMEMKVTEVTVDQGTQFILNAIFYLKK